MAFEYLMAHYLLTGQLADVAVQIERLGSFGYSEIPPAYAEAVSIYAQTSAEKPDLHGLTVSESVAQRAREVLAMAARFGQNKSKLRDALAEKFPNSYFRYLLGGRAGGAK